MKVTIAGHPRSTKDYLKWDFKATTDTKEKLKKISWVFAPQSKKSVVTKTLSAPGYVWTKTGKKTVTVTVEDIRGNKGSATMDLTVVKPTFEEIEQMPGVKPLPVYLGALGEGTYEIHNLSKGNNSTKVGSSNYGFYTKGDVVGQGSDRTIITIEPYSSNKKSAVPVVDGDGGGLANPTNNMYLGRVEGLSRVIGGFTLVGTKQGHLYNGLRIDRVASLRMEDVIIRDVPGDAPGNPGETFLVNGQRLSSKAYFRDIALIGGTGVLSSAAGLGLNSTKAKVQIEGLLTKNLKQSAGIATWQQTGDIEILGWIHDGPARNFGAERLAADVVFHDPVNRQLRTTRGKHDATYTWGDHEAGDYKGGSLTWIFSSEEALKRYLIPGRNKIYVLTNKQSAKQGIKKSARVVVAGRDRTSDLLVWAGA